MSAMHLLLHLHRNTICNDGLTFVKNKHGNLSLEHLQSAILCREHFTEQSDNKVLHAHSILD